MAHLSNPFGDIRVNAFNGRHNVVVVGSFHFIEQELFLFVKVVRDFFFKFLKLFLLAFVELLHLFLEVVELLPERFKVEKVLFEPYTFVYDKTKNYFLRQKRRF